MENKAQATLEKIDSFFDPEIYGHDHWKRLHQCRCPLDPGGEWEVKVASE